MNDKGPISISKRLKTKFTLQSSFGYLLNLMKLDEFLRKL